LLAGGTPLFANTTDDTSAGAIQAIQQASDPSAAIAAYANGIATDRNNPRIHEAYIAKMVDLGLPEMAFHQAESLTGLESNNGLAWGVVAYVDARRGQMSEAISAVVLAGQFAPDNAFVQRTAGELTAWYDLKADKSALSDSTKDAMVKIRANLEKRTAFADAYNAATKAYKGQTNTTQPPAQSSVAPNPAPAATADQQAYSTEPVPGSYGPPYPYDYGDYAAYPPPYAYYPDYGPYYWGPGWISPAAWWWWPVGSWFGFSFFPCSSFCVFDHHHGHFHDGFHNGNFHSHNGFVAHNGSFHGTHNGGKFFSSHTGPNFGKGSATFGHMGNSANFHGAGTPSVLGSTPRNAVNTRVGAVTGTRSTSFGRGFTSTAPGNRSVTPTSRMGNNFSGQRTWNNSGVTSRAPGVTTRTWNGSTGVGSRAWNSSAFANRTWNTTASSSRAWSPARQSFAPQSFGGRSFAGPQGRSFAGMGGGFHGGGGMGGFHGGGMGGFHGGGMGGGGFHGGGGMGGGHGGGGGGGHR
jgi:hypothetical protein